MYLPQSASAGKAAKLAALGACLVRVRGDCVEAEAAARAEAERLAAMYISPYNDAAVSRAMLVLRFCASSQQQCSCVLQSGDFCVREHARTVRNRTFTWSWLCWCSTGQKCVGNSL